MNVYRKNTRARYSERMKLPLEDFFSERKSWRQTKNNKSIQEAAWRHIWFYHWSVLPRSLDQVGAPPLYPFCFVWASGWAFFRWLRILQKTSFRSQSHHRSQLDYLIFACSNYHGKNFLYSSEEPASPLGPSIDLLGSACPLPLGVVRDS